MSAISTTNTTNSTSVVPKIYTYYHCPYCVRVELILGLKSIPHQLIFLPNSDEKAHLDLCGSKQVPILQLPDNTIILESLDIVKYFDENYKNNEWTLLPAVNNSKLTEWINTSKLNKLTHPRYVKIGLPEFSRQIDIDYFTNKKEKDIGSFTENLNNTAQLKQREEELLLTIVDCFPTVTELESGSINSICGQKGQYSYDDILIFPRLRGLTIVKDFKFPENIKLYIDNLAKLANIPMYYDRAI